MSQNHAKNNQNRLHNLPRKDFEIYISKKWETSLKIIPKTIRKINVGICTIHQKLKFSKNVECVKNLGFYCVARISPKFSRYIRRSATRGKNVPKSCSKRGRHLQWKTWKSVPKSTPKINKKRWSNQGKKRRRNNNEKTWSPSSQSEDKMMPKDPNGRILAPKMATKVNTGASGVRTRPSQDSSGDTFWPSFLNSFSLWHPLASILGAQGCPMSSVGATNWLLVWS